jgi:leucyl aminopeptidase (aminopeptidase T)
MKDPRIEKLAEMLVKYSAPIKSGDKAVIQGSSVAAPLIREIYKQILLAGGYPLVMASIPGVEEILYKYAKDDQLQFIHEGHRIIFDTYQARYAIICDVNTDQRGSSSHVQSPQSAHGYFQTLPRTYCIKRDGLVCDPFSDPGACPAGGNESERL